MPRVHACCSILTLALVLLSQVRAEASDWPERFTVLVDSPASEIVVTSLDQVSPGPKRYRGTGRIAFDDGSSSELALKARRKERRSGAVRWRLAMRTEKGAPRRVRIVLRARLADGVWTSKGRIRVREEGRLRVKLKAREGDLLVGAARKRWTYMVYMGADNNLTFSGLVDLDEMESVGSGPDVNIVLQAEFSRGWDPSGILDAQGYQGETLRFLVRDDGNPGDVDLGAGQSLGNLDMGSPDTLRDFVQWATTAYPADHYALVVWDHGSGWKKSGPRRGAVEDETSASFMSLPDLGKAVRESGAHLDVLNFDCCLMGMYEVAYEFLGLCDYFVASEETEPGDGDPYDRILAALRDDPAMTPEQLARTIVLEYGEDYALARVPGITKSAVDMDSLVDLHDRIVALASAIEDEWAVVSGAVRQAQESSQCYQVPENHDLHDFCSQLSTYLAGESATRTAALSTMDAVASCVVESTTNGDGVAASHGIAIYAPTRNQVSLDAVKNDVRDYAALACNASRAEGWLDAVELMSATQADEVLVTGGFGVSLTWDTDADLDLWVWEPGGSADFLDDLYSPWVGQTSPNGFFSGDSQM
ncbi:MAG: clostripain-related cysteine peptidase, partial [Planctomycetota bacterium]